MLRIPGHYTKPPPGAQIKWGHPLANNMAEAFSFSEGSGSATFGMAQNTVGDLELAGGGALPDWNGEGLRFRGAGGALGGRVQIANPPPRLAALTHNPFSFAMRFVKFGADGVDYALCSQANGAGLGRIWARIDPVNDHIQFLFQGAALDSNITATIGTAFDLAGAWDGSVLRIYVDGQERNSAVRNCNEGATGDLLIGCNKNINNRHFGGRIDYTYYWARCLQSRDVSWLHAEPYAMIDAPVWRRYFDFDAAISIYGRRTLWQKVGHRDVMGEN